LRAALAFVKMIVPLAPFALGLFSTLLVLTLLRDLVLLAAWPLHLDALPGWRDREKD
jgi:hypothetical protein